jgi:hypothetical protein
MNPTQTNEAPQAEKPLATPTPTPITAAQRHRSRESAKSSLQRVAGMSDELDQFKVALANIALGAGNRINQTRQELADDINRLRSILRVTEFRTMALQNILKSKFGVTDDDIRLAADQASIAAFEVESEQDDKTNGLVEFDGAIENGTTIIAHIAPYDQDGKLDEGQVIIRSKFEVGKGEMAESIETNAVGKKAGDTYEAPFKVVGKDYTARVTILSLRVRKPKDEQAIQAGQEAPAAAE